jgi:hypothetical protein
MNQEIVNQQSPVYPYLAVPESRRIFHEENFNGGVMQE